MPEIVRRRSSLRPVALALASAAVLALTAMSDWPLGFLQEYWAQHGMITNIVASLLFIVLGLTILDQWAANRERTRLRVVILVAYHAIARIPLTQRRLMWLLVNGGEFLWDQDFALPVDLERIRVEILARYRLHEVMANDVRSGATSLPSLDERIVLLASDAQWRALCYKALRELNHSMRLVLARWASLLSTTNESARVLVETSAQLEELAELTSWFRRHSILNHTPDSGEAIDEVVTRWKRAFTNAIALEEGVRIMRLVSGEAYSYGDRNLLDHAERELLFPIADSRPRKHFRIYR